MNQELYTFRMLHMTANSISQRLLEFSGWVITGNAAIVGLIITNVDKISPFVQTDTISVVVKLFVLTSVLHLAQRYMSLMVSASALMANVSKEMPVPDSFNPVAYIEDFNKSLYFLPRRNLAKVIDKMNEGDSLFGARRSMKSAQKQTLLVLLQSICVVSSFLVLAIAL